MASNGTSLDVFIGRWLTEGETVAAPGAPVARILASDGGRVMTAKHERSEDGVTWVPSMEVRLSRVG
jgi:hypothetical protein